jgi:hypothetical protein
MRRLVYIAALILSTSALASAQGGAGAPAGGAQPPARTQKPPQNLKVLPMTANIRSEMTKITEALGVKCDQCHVQGNFPSDEKKDKLTARKMMQMVKDLNANMFPGHKVSEGDSALGSAVTCFTCHRGDEHPATAPPKAPGN